MKKFNQFTTEAKGYRDVNRQVAAADAQTDAKQAKNVLSKGKKLGNLETHYSSGKIAKGGEVYEYKGKKWLVFGKNASVFVPMKYHKIVKESKIGVGDIVIAKKGPHKGDKHKVIHVFDDGKLNIQPLTRNVKYRHGAAGAKPSEVELVNEDKEQIDEILGFGKKKTSPGNEKKKRYKDYKDDKAANVNKYGIRRDQDIPTGSYIEFVPQTKSGSGARKMKGNLIGKIVGQPPESYGDLYRVEIVKSNDLRSQYKVGKVLSHVFYSQIIRVLSGKVVEQLEEEIANAVSGGEIAGISDNNPPVKKKRRKFAGTECFEVTSEQFQRMHLGHMKNERWDKYLDDECDTCQSIRAYARRYPQKDIVIQREGCGTMTYLKRKGQHY